MKAVTMSQVMRRSMCLLGVSLLIPRRVFAYSTPDYKDLQTRFKQLNAVDTENDLKETKESLKKWKPTEGHVDYVLQCDNKALLDDISYIKTLYEKPLKTYQRINLRNRLIKFFNEAKTEEEKKFIFSIIEYYGLLND
jgi:hypothetical protein